MMSTTSNPAGRLHNHLVAVTKRPDNERMRAAWAHVFGLENEKDTGGLLERLSALIGQLAAAKAQILAMDGDQAVLLRPLQQLEKQFSKIDPDEQLRAFKGRLPATTLDTLGVVAHTLHLRDPAGEIPKEALNELLKEVEALAERIRKEELEAGAKAGMTELVERLRRAIVEYGLRGPEGVVEAVDLSLGYALRTYTSTKSERVRDALSDLARVSIRAAATVKAVQGLMQFGGEILKRLASGG